MYETSVLDLFQDVKLALGNKKTGPAWSIPNVVTCPGRTKTCESLCYASVGRMALHQRKGGAYYTRWHALVKLLAMPNGTHLASLALQARCRAQSTVRIHDSGDFFSPQYIQAWIETVRACPDTKFWAYTRSWRVPTLSPWLKELAAEPNVAIWVSSDVDCWIAALAEARDNHEYAGIAHMQTEDDTDIPTMLQRAMGKARFLNFPAHGSFGRHLTTTDTELRNCPAVTGSIPVPKKLTKDTPAACLACKICLPKA